MPRKKAPKGSGMQPRLRPDGRWEARYTPPGAARPKAIYAKTEEECARKLRKAVAEIDGGVYQEPSKLTVKAWADIWLAEYCGGVKDTTHDKYEMYVRLYIKPELGGFKLHALGAHSIQGMSNKLQRREKRPLSGKYVNNILGALHLMMEQAVRLRYRPDNPCDAVIKPRVEKREMRTLRDGKLDDFLAAIKGRRFESVYLVDVFTGMRQGEILGLTWADVDFKGGVVHVRKQLQKERKKDGQYRRVSLKNDRIRDLHPAPFVMDILKAEQLKQKEARVRAGGAWDNAMNLVFTNQLGRYQSASTVYKDFKRIVTSIEEGGVRFHDIRHTFALLRLQNGADIKTLQHELGHATAAFTLDVYGHVSEEMLQASADSMQQYINEWKGRQSTST